MRRGEVWWGGASCARRATIPKTLIRQRIAVLSAEKMQEVEAAIRFALDLIAEV